jgi:hypothetical protein
MRFSKSFFGGAALMICSLFYTGSASAAPYGTYYNPIEDHPFDGDWSGPVHRGMYCVNGTWHHGWLREGEGKMVIKDSCGTAIYQIR